ncbi:hypothetical protein Syun_029268 [Stephania yunnanensis]|uniref:DWNN domain-containing protein n=1 Tax=Stephania yunnanensis TaxID=152371 RepID=A0AAP0EDA7_9MAGN
MAVYYKFKSAKDYDSIPIDGHFISVANLKEKIFESKHLGRGTDFDLMVANAQTNEEYIDEAALIPKNTSVLVRRIPGRPRMPIVTEREDTKPIDNKEEDVQSSKSGLPLADASIMRYPEETEWDEFGNDLYAIPEMLQAQSSNMVQEATVSNKADEDSKIKALVDNSALDWLRQPQDAFGAGRGFGRGMGGRMMGSRGFGRGGGMFERKTPPAGYICHRCKIPGHFIQHCPTNGDPNYDIKKVKPPTGIPKSMLMATPDGSYALPSGAVAVLKPNEAAFEKEIEGLPSTRSVTDIPPELRCPLCKEVMKDAVLTSKCCFKSFCDKCIRDHIISKSACICGATNVLADDLLPNKTLRDTINRLLESNNSSAENVGSMLQIQDMESARPARPKIPSPSLSAAPTLSAASKGELMPPPPSKDNVETKDIAIESQDVSKSPVEPQQSAPTGPHQSVSAGPQQNAPTGTQQLLEKGRTAKAADISEATHESMTVKETTSQGSAAVVEEEVQQKPSASEPGKKKKKKKVRMPLNGAELQWRTPQDFAADGGYGMMPYGPSACNPYWGGMVGMDGFMNPYAGAMPYMGYVPGPFDVPLGGMGGMLPQDPFGGYMMPPVVPPQRDLSELAMGAKPGPPVMSREEFEARKADLRRKREIEQRGAERSFSKERDYARELSGNGDVPSMKSKHVCVLPSNFVSVIFAHVLSQGASRGCSNFGKKLLLSSSAAEKQNAFYCLNENPLVIVVDVEISYNGSQVSPEGTRTTGFRVWELFAKKLIFKVLLATSVQPLTLFCSSGSLVRSMMSMGSFPTGAAVGSLFLVDSVCVYRNVEVTSHGLRCCTSRPTFIF